MNNFEENRLDRLAELRRERSIILGHKYQASLEEYIALDEFSDSLVDEIIQSQARIQTLAITALGFGHIEASCNLRQCFNSLRKIQLLETKSLETQKHLAETLGSLVAEFLLLERCLTSYKKSTLRSLELRSLLAPSELEEFVLPSGLGVTILPPLMTQESKEFKVLAFDQSQSLQEIANGIKLTQT